MKYKYYSNLMINNNNNNNNNNHGTDGITLIQELLFRTCDYYILLLSPKYGTLILTGF